MCACGITVKWERQSTVVAPGSPRCVYSAFLSPSFSSSFSRLSRSSAPRLSVFLSPPSPPPSRGRLGYSRYLRRVRVHEPRTVLRRLRCNERSRQETRGRSCTQGEYSSLSLSLFLVLRDLSRDHRDHRVRSRRNNRETRIAGPTSVSVLFTPAVASPGACRPLLAFVAEMLHSWCTRPLFSPGPLMAYVRTPLSLYFPTRAKSSSRNL